MLIPKIGNAGPFSGLSNSCYSDNSLRMFELIAVCACMLNPVDEIMVL